ncbi:hypothetical protein DFJ73DRAFT_759474 [Zopfochytrium polystomum]|nr:hypothetical protein DFJ73DRAFT_759474 [Zopfochytrium polystomum]
MSGELGQISILSASGEPVAETTLLFLTTLSKIPIDDPICTMGRDDDCTIRLYDQRFSKNHAQLVSNDDGKIYLVRLSDNPVTVNGKDISKNIPTELAKGDVFALTNLRFVFEPPEKSLDVATEPTFRPKDLGSRISKIPAPTTLVTPENLAIAKVDQTHSVGIQSKALSKGLADTSKKRQPVKSRMAEQSASAEIVTKSAGKPSSTTSAASIPKVQFDRHKGGQLQGKKPGSASTLTKPRMASVATAKHPSKTGDKNIAAASRPKASPKGTVPSVANPSKKKKPVAEQMEPVSQAVIAAAAEIDRLPSTMAEIQGQLENIVAEGNAPLCRSEISRPGTETADLLDPAVSVTNLVGDKTDESDAPSSTNFHWVENEEKPTGEGRSRENSEVHHLGTAEPAELSEGLDSEQTKPLSPEIDRKIQPDDETDASRENSPASDSTAEKYEESVSETKSTKELESIPASLSVGRQSHLLKSKTESEALTVEASAEPQLTVSQSDSAAVDVQIASPESTGEETELKATLAPQNGKAGKGRKGRKKQPPKRDVHESPNCSMEVVHSAEEVSSQASTPLRAVMESPAEQEENAGGDLHSVCADENRDSCAQDEIQTTASTEPSTAKTKRRARTAKKANESEQGEDGSPPVGLRRSLRKKGATAL